MSKRLWGGGGRGGGYCLLARLYKAYRTFTRWGKRLMRQNARKCRQGGVSSYADVRNMVLLKQLQYATSVRCSYLLCFCECISLYLHAVGVRYSLLVESPFSYCYAIFTSYIFWYCNCRGQECHRQLQRNLSVSDGGWGV